MKQKVILSCLFLTFIFLISSISAYYGYSSSNLPSTFLINETTTNVNNSQYLEGHPASYFYPYSNPYSFYNSTTLPDLNSTGLIKDWNVDGYIKDWNNTGLIINWSIDTSNFYLKSNPFSFWNDTYATFNKTYADTLYAPAGAGNASWNQSLADTLYYSITNPYGFYNSTNFVITDYYLKSNPFGFYNVTTLPNLNSTGLIKDWNATGYIKNWNSTGLIINWSIDTSSFYLNSNPYGYYNITTAPIYINDTFAGNYSNYLSLFNWNKTYADTLYYGLSNPYGYYNSSTAPIYINDTFAGNYSTFLTHITWTEATNGTLALASQIVDFNSSGLIRDWNSTGFIKNWTVDIDLLNASGLIRNWNASNLIIDWNSTGLIKDWNSTGLIANWSIDTSNFYTKDNPYGFYNITTAPIYVNDTFGANYSTYLTLFNWNKTYADTLYYSLSNPNSYYNSTTIPAYYPLNNPYGYYNSTSFDINNYYLKSNPYSYYNSTTLTTNSQLLNGNNYWNSTFATFNKTYADTLYANTTWAYNQTTPAINTILGFNYYNVTNAPIYLNDTFRGSNYSTFLTHIDWSKAVNGTLALNSSLANYYLNSNPNSYYNITTAPTYINDTFAGNYSTFLTHIDWSKATNGTLALASSIPTNNNQLLNGNNYWNNTYATFNKTYADTLYYGIGNSYGYYNSSTIPSYMPSAYASNNTFYPYSSNPANYLTSFTELDPKAYNGTLAFNSSLSNYLLKTEWNATNTSYYLASNPSGYIDWSKAINGTLALSSAIPTNNNQLLNGNGYYNSSSFVITDYYLKSNPYGYYNITSFDINNYYLKSNPYAYYNATTAPIYLNDTFRGSNYTTFLTHITWANAVNGTLALASSVPTNNNQLTNGNAYWNNTYATFNKTYADTLYYGLSNPYGYYNSSSFSINDYYLKSNPYGYYNSTTIPAYLTAETLWNANYSTFLTHINWATAYNGTLAKTDAINTFNSIQTFGANVTLTNNYLTNGTGGAYIRHNGTGWVIKG